MKVRVILKDGTTYVKNMRGLDEKEVQDIRTYRPMDDIPSTIDILSSRTDSTCYVSREQFLNILRTFDLTKWDENRKARTFVESILGVSASAAFEIVGDIGPHEGQQG